MFRYLSRKWVYEACQLLNAGVLEYYCSGLFSFLSSQKKKRKEEEQERTELIRSSWFCPHFIMLQMSLAVPVALVLVHRTVLRVGWSCFAPHAWNGCPGCCLSPGSGKCLRCLSGGEGAADPCWCKGHWVQNRSLTEIPSCWGSIREDKWLI